MEQPQPARLEDVISYTPESYFTTDDVALIRGSFNGAQGAKLLKVIRKALVPTIADPDLPVEEFMKDMFMAQVDFTKMQVDEAKAVAMGLQLATKIMIGAIINLRNIANIKEETSTEAALRRAKDSGK